MGEQAKHTPGPWRVFSERDAAPGIEAPSLSIVTLGESYAGDGEGVHGHSKRESLANARLIAAAPDLLEALELVTGSLLFDREDDTSREVMRRVSVAIRKAKEG